MADQELHPADAAQIERWFGPRRTPDEMTTYRHETVRFGASALAKLVHQVVPDGPDRAAALRHLRVAVGLCVDAIDMEPTMQGGPRVVASRVTERAARGMRDGSVPLPGEVPS